jgi:hypothetical protein
MSVIHTTEYDGGYFLDQLIGDSGDIYYRACKGGVCRYAEDHYIAMMYLEGMGWDPKQQDLP